MRTRMMCKLKKNYNNKVTVLLFKHQNGWSKAGEKKKNETPSDHHLISNLLRVNGPKKPASAPAKKKQENIAGTHQHEKPTGYKK